MIKTIATTTRTSLPKTTLGETLGLAAGVIVPILAQGVIIRRPKLVALAERLDLNQRVAQRVQRLRNKYGTGPLLLHTTPWWLRALILSPEHAHRVLNHSPEPFTTCGGSFVHPPEKTRLIITQYSLCLSTAPDVLPDEARSHHRWLCRLSLSQAHDGGEKAITTSVAQRRWHSYHVSWRPARGAGRSAAPAVGGLPWF
jgi:hypothetical protein